MTMQNNEWATELVHLLALASRMEGKGQYNIAKVLRASADAIARRAAYQLNLTRDTATLIEEIERAKQALVNHEVNPDFVAALELGQEAMTEGRLPLIDEILHPHVCRRCGQSYLGEPSIPCPTCGDWPSTFQRFLPVYWLNELEPIAAQEKLRKTPEQIAALLKGLDEQVLSKKPEDGGWSIRQVVTHLRDAQGVLHARIKLLVEQDNPILTSQAVFEWATQEEGKPTATQQIFGTYWTSRKETITLLEGVPLKEWWRAGQHEEFGKVSLKQQVSYFAAHELVHLRQINVLRP